MFEPISNMFPEANAKTISREHISFYYAVLREALIACIEARYSAFDAHTAATCCHGVALFALNLINEISIENALDIKNKLDEKLLVSEDLNGSFQVPSALMWLCRLFILNMVKTADLNRGYITDYLKLKDFFPLSGRFFSQLTKSMQKQIANLVADRYRFYLENLPHYASAHGLPINLWGKYISHPYTRTSSNGIVYISNLFSMRVALSYLSYNHFYISLINDVIGDNNTPVYRYVSLFLGDGKGGFDLVSSSQSDLFLSTLNDKIPVFVLGGVAYLQDFNKENFLNTMKIWEGRLLELVLACDVWYPQFPAVAGDSVFNSSPIVPHEIPLQNTLDLWKHIEGVRAEDPSLCCLAHIYPASLKEIIVELKGNHPILPWSFIPSNLRGSHLSISSSFLADQ